MLLGAALNLRPGLFGAAVLRVPFLDMLTSMTDPALPLTVHEYGEWGDPGQMGAPDGEEQPVLRLMERLCPYHNLLPAPGDLLLQQAAGHDPLSLKVSAVIDDDTINSSSSSSSSEGSVAMAVTGLSPGQLPPVLVSCSLRDARVPFWVPAKWVARARSLSQAHPGGQHQHPIGPVVLRVREEGGHHGSTEQQFEELAEDYAFLIKALLRGL